MRNRNSRQWMKWKHFSNGHWRRFKRTNGKICYIYMIRWFDAMGDLQEKMKVTRGKNNSPQIIPRASQLVQRIHWRFYINSKKNGENVSSCIRIKLILMTLNILFVASEVDLSLDTWESMYLDLNQLLDLITDAFMNGICFYLISGW